MTMTMTTPVIDVREVWFAYPPGGREQAILQGVSLTVPPLDFLGIVGPNGGGKTTLLKVMLGLLKPQVGSVRVLGDPPCRIRHRIGYVPQHASIDHSVPASVLDIVLMGRLAGNSWGMRYRRDDINAAMRSLERTQLADLASRPIRSLSGGQRQRVLIARALASDAAILILDEPTAGVDSHAERSLTDLMHQLNQTLPIIMVSHDIAFVSTHLKRVACLNRTLTVHGAHEISSEVISHMYHGPVLALHHAEECPLHDPGCAHHCHPHEPAPAHAEENGSGV